MPTQEPYFHFFSREEPIGNLSGNLPHWRQLGATYFVTFRTADSIPMEKLRQWTIERDEWLRLHPEPHSDSDRVEFIRRFPARFQQWLDECHGACVLGRPEIKKMMTATLRHFDGQRYQLGEFVVMPNHIHALVTPLHDFELSNILHSWKSFTASRINKQLGQRGTFWQKETFDHIVRSADALERFGQYIRENPKGHGAK